MTGDDFISAAFSGADDGGDENTVALYAFHGFFHGIIISNGKRMIREVIQL